MKDSAKKHVIFWSCYFVFCYVSDLLMDPKSSLIAEIIFYFTQNLFLFYSLLYVLEKYSSTGRNRVIKSLLRLLIIIAIFFPVRYFFRYYILSKYVDSEFGELGLQEWAVNGILWIVNYFFLASAYFYFESFIRQQNVLSEMVEDKLIKENEQLELQNALLKAQINPHFLYNSLNFLYAKALPLSKELSGAILNLSEIMRYSFQTQNSDGLVPLTDEVAHLRNVIEMARLRYNNNVFLELSISENINGQKIIPLVFVTLVENVLKHGQLDDKGNPATINIELTDRQELHFSTWNQKRTGPKETTTSIGLKNTVKRLEETYGNRCTINITDDKDDFRTSIKINLEKTP